MAAQYVPRLCLSCGTDISARYGNCIRCLPCQVAHTRTLRLASMKKKTRAATDFNARPEARFPADPPHRSVKWCDYCAGMPDARVPDRSVNGSIGSPMVANENGICNGCGQPWAPAPPIPRGPSIRSSAGTCAKDSMFYGVRINNQVTGTERKKDK